MQDIIKDLQTRGIIHDIMHGTAEQLAENKTKVYAGVDATASSLHIGNLATFMILRHLQKTGHQPYVIIGGATSLVGDPSFRAKGRSEMDIETLRHNQDCIYKQMQRLFKTEKPPVILLNNYDWLHQIPFLTFLREVGKYVTINYMTGKEAVKNRMATGMSYTEFAYQLLQGYDFYHLYTKHGVKMQIGGADQWANITTGAELIRKKAAGTAFGFTTPLLTRADGTKFGKTADGENVWLDPTMTSPYRFYQFWLNRTDQEASTCLYRMTLHPLEKIQAWEKAHAQAPHMRLLQKTLAQSLTTLIHGEEAFHQAIAASKLLFDDHSALQKNNAIKEETLMQALEGIPQINLSQEELADSKDLLDLVTTTTKNKIFPSRRIAREIIHAGALRINKVKITDPATPLPILPPWIKKNHFLIQKGKKHYFLIRTHNT